MISLKSQRELEIIRNASEQVKSVFEELKSIIKPGISTQELDTIAEKVIIKQGGIPAFKNYHGYPANICTSINDEVVHGIPSGRRLCEGDIISIDVGVKYKGYHSDAARTFPVGNICDETQRLIRVTRESLENSIKTIKIGSRLGDLSNAIQTFIEKNGYAVVRDFVGHGIGRDLHEEPQIPNFGEKGQGPLLEAGMVLAIEPMVNMGTWKVRILENQWTVVTLDSKLSAHHENTIAILDGKVEVLT